eukprot:6199991-Prymnesium_polylepis.1
MFVPLCGLLCGGPLPKGGQTEPSASSATAASVRRRFFECWTDAVGQGAASRCADSPAVAPRAIS